MVMLTNTLPMAKTHSNFLLSKNWSPHPPKLTCLFACVLLSSWFNPSKYYLQYHFNILLSLKTTNNPCQFFFSLWSLDQIEFLIVKIITSTTKDEILVLNTQHHPLLPYGPFRTHKTNGMILSILWGCFNAFYFQRTKLFMNISTTKDWVAIHVSQFQTPLLNTIQKVQNEHWAIWYMASTY
jgi:hypothetical protein